MKKFSWLLAAVSIMSACSMGGFKPGPDADSGWKLTDYNKLYPATVSKTMHNYSSEEYYRQNDEFSKKKHDDFWGCNYDPMGGGTKRADACLRKKGWYQTGFDLYPENKQYEWPRSEN